MTVKYKARAHFDIETEVEVPDDEAVDTTSQSGLQL